MGFNTVGIYPFGTNTEQSTWFRPHQNCKMFTLGPAFCPVCKENLIDRIYEKIRPIDAYLPDTVSILPVLGAPAIFSFTPIRTNPNTFKYQWILNGTLLSSKDTFVQIDQSQLLAGANSLTAVITDTTLMSRSYTPANGSMFSIQWKLNRDWVTSITSINAANKFTYKLFPVPAKNEVTLYCNNSTSATAAHYSITTIAGSVAKKGTVSLAQGEQNIPFSITGLAPGVYNLALQGDGILIDTRFIVE